MSYERGALTSAPLNFCRIFTPAPHQYTEITITSTKIIPQLWYNSSIPKTGRDLSEYHFLVKIFNFIASKQPDLCGLTYFMIYTII